MPRSRYAPRPRPMPIPSHNWNAEPTQCLRINERWVGHILGALEVLDQPDTWIGTEEEIQAARDQINEFMAAIGECEEIPAMSYPIVGSIAPQEMRLINGVGAFNWTALNGAMFGGYYLAASPAIGDEFAGSINLAEGTYLLQLRWSATTDGAIIDIEIDGTVVVNDYDLYAAATNNAAQANFQVTIVGSGNHLLKIRTVGKRAAATTYRMRLIAISMNAWDIADW